MFGGLLKDKTFGSRLVPIVADEARTFGMDNLFRQVGIYSPDGQLYEPEDADSMLWVLDICIDSLSIRWRARSKSEPVWLCLA